MDNNIWTPNNILLTSTSLKLFWQEVDEDFWQSIKDEYEIQQDILSKSRNLDECRSAAVNILELFSERKDLLSFFADELISVNYVKTELINEFQTIMFPHNSIEEDSYSSDLVLSCIFPSIYAEDGNRFILLPKAGLGGAKSIKLKNVTELRIHDFFETLAGLLLVGGEDKYHANPIVVCAGLLLTINGLLKLSTQEISENEASVLWGFYLARDKSKNTCDEEKILNKTNRERKEYGLDVIDEKAIRNALTRLSNSRCVERLPDKKTWRLNENIIFRR